METCQNCFEEVSKTPTWVLKGRWVTCSVCDKTRGDVNRSREFKRPRPGVITATDVGTHDENPDRDTD